MIISNNFIVTKSIIKACICKTNVDLCDFLPCVEFIYISFTKTEIIDIYMLSSTVYITYIQTISSGKHSIGHQHLSYPHFHCIDFYNLSICTIYNVYGNKLIIIILIICKNKPYIIDHNR